MLETVHLNASVERFTVEAKIPWLAKKRHRRAMYPPP